VADNSGRRCAGCVVRFEAIAAPGPTPPAIPEYRVYLRVPDAEGLTVVAFDTTDANGNASIHLTHGYLAGLATVVVTVPERGYLTSAHFDIRPGAIAAVQLTPNDTAAYAGQTITLRGRAVDRVGNSRDEPVTLAVVSGPAVVSGNGVATLSAIGRVTIVAQLGSMTDTAHVSVVPRGELASEKFNVGNGGPIGIFHVETNGSVLGPLADGVSHEVSIHGWEWSPDGRAVVVARGRFINFVAVGGIQRPLLEMNGSLLPAARISRDGQWIYFTQEARSQPHRGMFRVGSDGTKLQPLGQSSPSFGLDRYPAPSHDDSSVVYVTDRSPCGVDECIQVLDLATNQDRTYGTRTWLAQGRIVACSPVQDLIAYARGSRIAVIRSDGSGDRTLADDIHAVTWMDWSPDGRWLVVAGSGPVLLIDVHTGMRLPIPQLDAFGPTAWRP